jgi:glutamate carboxypeptidase
MHSFLIDHSQEMINDLREAVIFETPSNDKLLLDEFADHIARKARDYGAETAEKLTDADYGDHVLAGWQTQSRGRPVLLVGHFDTVWPSGTLRRMPYRHEAGLIYGPGCFDMKAGLIIGLWAIRAYRHAGGTRPISFFMNSDEETGSLSSSARIKDLAAAAAFCLVLEPALDGGGLKTARRGLSRYRVEIAGRASHSGLDPDAGISAIDELCRLIPEIEKLSAREAGTDVNVGVITGGTRYNVVPGHSECEVGIRVLTEREGQRTAVAMRQLKPRHPEAKISVTESILWPPMERTERIGSLADQARNVALALGTNLPEGRSGGSGDACHCASAGAAVLDGLGAIGGGAHADGEYVVASALPLRAAIVAGLMTTVGDDAKPIPIELPVPVR